MAKNKGLHISKDRLHTLIKQNGTIRNAECVNEANKQFKYEIEMNGYSVELSVYFRKDNTISCVPQGSGKCGELSKGIVSYIKENADFNNISTGTFTCELSKDKFKVLVEYLISLEGVTIISNEEKGINGQMVQFISDIGDKITLTFWEAKSKMLFQGYLMLLHVEVKSFISAYSYVKTELDNIGEEKKSEKAIKVNEIINKIMPCSYNKLEPLFQDLIYDSIVQLIERNELRDYSAWAFPVLKALEGRTKQILLFENIRVNDKIGFKFNISEDTVNKEYKNIFLHNGINHIVDTSIIPITDVNTLNALRDCYSYLCKQRNPNFHVSQVLRFTRKLEKPEDADNIIYETCKIIEKSYVLLGK